MHTHTLMNAHMQTHKHTNTLKLTWTYTTWMHTMIAILSKQTWHVFKQTHNSNVNHCTALALVDSFESACLC